MKMKRGIDWTQVAVGGLVVIAFVALAIEGVTSRGLGAGVEAPKAQLPLLSGGAAEVPATRKVTVLDFWATWCEPCRRSMPALDRIVRDLSDEGLRAYAVNTDDESPDRAGKVAEFVARLDLTMPVAMDDGTVESRYRVSALPTLVVVGRDGKVRSFYQGARWTEEALRADLRRALSD
jgi:thiol-disulfide isomerase/thioredoxin